MIEVQPANGPCLDICRTCQFIWFDDQEYERVPRTAELEYSIVRKSTERPLPQRARELLAEDKVRRMAEDEAFTGPPETWQYLPALFGFPVECERQSSKVPGATWTIAFLIALVSGLAFTNLEAVVATFGLIPAEAFRWGGFTFVTSFFLHGGILHLVGNLYFLVMCGDNAEELLGARRFLLLLLAATLGGDILHVLADSSATVPCIGASGGISGVIAFYALALPHARLGFFFSWFFRFRWVAAPAWVAFLLWIGLQLLGAVEQLSGFSNVSAMAHLGGAAVGFVAWLLWKRSR